MIPPPRPLPAKSAVKTTQNSAAAAPRHLPQAPGLRRAIVGAVLLLTSLSVASWQKAPAQPAAARYTNPILYADYSDPDVIRVGSDFYLVASSFSFVPGIPVLHSRDLVHWEIVAHVVPRLTMSPAYDMVDGNRYGGGVWAPAVRFHHGLFYLYFPTPGEGIFVSTAPRMTGPWSEPVALLPEPGLEDPCPFWDDDGNAYLVHSRKGAGPLILHRMSADGLHLLDPGHVIVQDPVKLHTLEGPKLYKRDGWYYIFAPMGGVAVGDQVVLRSRNIDGPYDVKHTLTQGSTDINGPHQGAWIDSPDGRSWFVHFQQRGSHGRILWLEPMRWQDGWPLMGSAARPGSDPSQVGEPVMTAELPVRTAPRWHIPVSDEFSSRTLGLQWEWNHNPDDSHWTLSERPGFLRLHPTLAPDLVHARNTLTETMQDESLEVTTLLDPRAMVDGDRAGLSIFERGLSSIGLLQSGEERRLVASIAGQDVIGPMLAPSAKAVYLRALVSGDLATYSFSVDGKTFQPLGSPVKLVFSWWKGARPALFAYNPHKSSGAADFDWFHYRQVPAATAPIAISSRDQRILTRSGASGR